ncbi:MAG: leucine-rich repeat domain-containing protein [bacterium]
MRKFILSIFSLLLSASIYASAPAVGNTFTAAEGEFTFDYIITTAATSASTTGGVTVTGLVGGNPTEATYADFVIPATVPYTVNGIIYTYNVTAVADSAFENSSNLKGSVIIGKNVETIGVGAFRYGGFTGSLTFDGASDNSSKLRALRLRSFMHCSELSGELHFPESLDSIYQSAFYKNYELSGTLSLENVTYVGNMAFYQCSSLSAVDLGSTLIYLGSDSFYQCSGFSGSLTIPASLTTIGDEAFYDCELSGELLIMGTTTSKYFGYSAFNKSDFTSIYIEGPIYHRPHESATTSTTTYDVFDYANLNSIGCVVYLDDVSTGYIYWSTLFLYSSSSYSSLIDVYQAENRHTTSIYNQWRKFQNFKTHTEYNEAYYTNAPVVGDTITDSEGDFTFDYVITTATTTHFITGAVTVTGLVGGNPADATYADFVIPATVEYTVDGITYTYNVTEVGYAAFHDLSNLKGSVIIGKNVEAIDSAAFASCGFTGSLTFDGASDNSSKLRVLRVRSFMYCHYLSGELNFPESLDSIYQSSFYQNYELSGSLSLENVTFVGNMAFYQCRNLSAIDLGSTLIYLGSDSFYQCSGFSGSLTIPASLTTIGDEAFYDCELSGELRIMGTTVYKYFGYSAFNNSDFTSIYIEGPIYHQPHASATADITTYDVFDYANLNSIGCVVYLDDVSDSYLYWSTWHNYSTSSYLNLIDVYKSEYKHTTALYNQWEKFENFNTHTYYNNACSIIFNANGGSGDAMPTQILSICETSPLDECTYVSNEYKFIGWSTSPTAETADFADGESVSSDDYDYGDQITLYAVWELQEFFYYTYEGYVFECEIDEGVTPTMSDLADRTITIRGIYPADATTTDVITIPTIAIAASGTGTEYTVNFDMESVIEDVDGKSYALVADETLPKFTVIQGTTATFASEFNATHLEMQCNNDVVSQLDFDVNDVNVTTLSIVRTIDNAQYYFFTLPFDIAIKDVVVSDLYSNGQYGGDVYGTNWEVVYYDEANRAKTGSTTTNWVPLGDDATLKAYQGYNIATNNASATFTFTKDYDTPTTLTTGGKIAVTATETDDSGNTTSIGHRGYNLVGLPAYVASSGGGGDVDKISFEFDSSASSDDEVIYGTPDDVIVTVPIKDGTGYTQTLSSIAKLEPLASFFIQAFKSGDIVYQADDNSPNYIQSFNAPMAVTAQSTPYAVVDLLQEGELIDMTAATFHEVANTTDYWSGFDMEKWSSFDTRAQIYILDKGYKLAVNGREYRTSDIVYLELYVPAAGEYSLALRNDNYLLEDVTTGEMATSLTVNATEAGYITGQYRIVINRIATSTDDVVSGDGSGFSDVNIYTSGSEIVVANVGDVDLIELYSASGQLIQRYTPNATQMTISGLTPAVYILRVDGVSSKVVVK